MVEEHAVKMTAGDVLAELDQAFRLLIERSRQAVTEEEHQVLEIRTQTVDALRRWLRSEQFRQEFFSRRGLR